MQPAKNEYLDQVVAQQARIEQDLKAKALGASGGGPRAPRNEPGLPGGSLGVRITGFWRLRTVIVPPNCWVVHTRRGRSEPLHQGLGLSFRFDPERDAYLVAPAAMQTILISAHCICRELQGVLVQAYVQWIIADFATAYRKLDFSDADEPTRVVNVQLREQAEAAIKDKVATMGIAEVLSDKQPIIDELLARLRSVAEGEGHTDKALGLRIVTVQIKEAVVSSARVWESLQKPFRADKDRLARLAELDAQAEVATREAAVRQAGESAAIENEAQLAILRGRAEADAYDRQQAETVRRREREEQDARTLAEARQQTALQALALETPRIEAEAEVARLKLKEDAEQRRLAAQSEIEVEQARWAAKHRREEAEVGLLEARQRVLNTVTAEHVQARLVDALPSLAEKLPRPTELRAYSLGGGAHGGAALGSLVADLLGIAGAIQGRLRSPAE